MNRALFALLAGVLVLGPLPAVRAADEVPKPETRLVAYFAEWGIYQRNYHVANIPADKLTHINYAFARVTPAGECVLFDSFAAIDKAYPGDRWDPPQLRGSFNQ